MDQMADDQSMVRHHPRSNRASGLESDIRLNRFLDTNTLAVREIWGRHLVKQPRDCGAAQGSFNVQRERLNFVDGVELGKYDPSEI